MAMFCRPLSAAVVLVALASVITWPVQRTDAFILRVSPAFQTEFLGDLPIKVGELVFIKNNQPTPTLLAQLATPLLKFDTRYTYVSMEWARETALETIDYVLIVRSLNTTIMATPNVTNVPVVGQISNVLPNFRQFNTSLVCLAKGTTVLSVDMFYNVTVMTNVTVPGSTNNMSMENSSDRNMTNPVTMMEPIVSAHNATLRIRKECAAPATPPPPTTPPEMLSDGEIAGIAIGSVFFITLVMVLVLILLRRYLALKKQHKIVAQDLVKMNELVEGEMRLRTTTGYSGYTDTTRAGLPPMEEAEIATLMARLREEHEDLKDFLLAESDIELKEEIGRGAFGRVYDGCVMKPVAGDKTDGGKKVALRVAIKTVKTAVRDKDIEEFLAEASLMKGFHHPNVVALIGICLEGNIPPKVCLEYMGKGDLRGYLRKSRGITETGEVLEAGVDDHPYSVETPQLLVFCLHIAQGMSYLEKKKFIHRDLATRNCMLNDQLIVKIGDFGLARDIHEDNYYRMGTARRLPVKWMSLESLQDQIYTTMSDVWSFGIVMWEVFSLGQSPYPGLANDELPIFLLSGKRLGRPQLCPEDLYAMMATCWSKEPSERPSFQEMARLLVDYKDSFYANMPLKMGLENQVYQNINPSSEHGSMSERAMSVSGYSHAGSMATGVTYVQDSEGRLYVYSQGSSTQYSTDLSARQYSTDSGGQYTGGSADFINPGYHLVNTNVIPEGFVCVNQGTGQQMVMMNTSSFDQLDPYRNVPVGITTIEEHEPKSPTTSMATSIPPPPPTMDSHRDGGDEFEANL